MGNRHETGGFPPVINPADNPFLHILRVSQTDPEYKYVSNLTDLNIRVGIAHKNQLGFSFIPQTDNLYISLLPPVQTVPPPQYDTQELVRIGIAQYEEQILSLIRPDTNVIACSHGSYWWNIPEQTISEVLVNNGYRVQESFIRLGGRKRVQEHGVVFHR